MPGLRDKSSEMKTEPSLMCVFVCVMKLEWCWENTDSCTVIDKTSQGNSDDSPVHKGIPCSAQLKTFSSQ